MKCTNCNHFDTCENADGIGLELLPPLTARGYKPDCHKCNHAHWAMSVSENKRTCLSGCGVEKPLNSESLKIKHQR